MKQILLSLLMLAALPALGQNPSSNTNPDPHAAQSKQPAPNQPGRLVIQAPEFFIQAPEFRQFTAENPELGQEKDAGCEVNILHASFDRPGRVMRVSSHDASAVAKDRSSAPPSLNIQLRNASAKPIAAVNLLARIKVKNTVYQLDSITRSFPLTLNNTNGPQRLQLAESALGFESLTIEQVTYTDGTTWRPEHKNSCGYRSTGSILVAK
jgi:hypothetical protein